MATEVISVSGGGKMDDYLKSLLSKLDCGELQVGFMEGATYPDGTTVAQVAFWDEFGTQTSPARPFFRSMVSKESPTWGNKLAKLLKATGDDGERSLSILGEDIKGALEQSIIDTNTPPNAPSTISAKGFNKPLIDTSHMKNSITYKVGD